MMGSARNWLSRLRIVVFLAACGGTLENRLRLLTLAMLALFWKLGLQRHLALDTRLWEISKYVARDSVVTAGGVKYAVTDLGGFWVLPTYEAWMWKYMKPARGDIFIDVGTQLGKYALRVAGMVGEHGLVLAIEPDPEYYAALLKGIELNRLKNVIALRIAAWDRETRLKLFQLGPHINTVKRDIGLSFTQVDARALDGVLAELKVNKVDWIKVDVEGAEPEVLMGLRETLDKYRPQIVVEISNDNREKVEELMRKLEYYATKISEIHDPTFGHAEYMYYTPRTPSHSTPWHMPPSNPVAATCPV